MIKLVSGLTILVLASLLIGGCASPNQPPLISSLIAGQERVSPSWGCHVQCFASDPDGDELSYSWSATGGSISGEDSTATWTAPETLGDYTIAVKVTDGRGGEDATELSITVAVNHPPEIISPLIAERQVLKKAMTTTIKCVASDPDEDKLDYTWSATGGSISGEEDTVTWVAPNTYGTYIITVTVTDGRGGEAIRTIEIIVTCCI